MQLQLDVYVRQRCAERGLSLSELCRQAGISRQTLYELERMPTKLPSLTTIVALAQVLDVHPMRLLQCVFDVVPIKPAVRRAAAAGDGSVFVGDVTHPDGTVVLPGQRFEKVWALQNVGRVHWRGRAMQCRDDAVAIYDPGASRVLVAPGLQPDRNLVPIPDTAPGDTVRVAAWFTAPTEPCSVVSYWKMVDADGRLCFPSSVGVWVMVRVIDLAGGAFAEAMPAD